MFTFFSACGGQQVYKDVFNKDGGLNVKAFMALLPESLL
jgi:hypothetical protein